MKQPFLQFSSIISNLKDYFKTNTDWSKENDSLLKAIRNGDADKIKKFFNIKNPLMVFSSFGPAVAINGSYDLFLKIEKMGIENNLIEKDFYETTFSWSFSRDNIDIMKHLVSKGHFSVSDIDEQIFKTIVNNDSNKILLFILYDLNYQVSDNTINWLTKTNSDVLEQIKKRDLFFQLNNMKVNDSPSLKRLKI